MRLQVHHLLLGGHHLLPHQQIALCAVLLLRCQWSLPCCCCSKHQALPAVLIPPLLLLLLLPGCLQEHLGAQSCWGRVCCCLLVWELQVWQ
jgi:hypothetical protein